MVDSGRIVVQALPFFLLSYFKFILIYTTIYTVTWDPVAQSLPRLITGEVEEGLTVDVVEVD